jgi:hypothetical protein
MTMTQDMASIGRGKTNATNEGIERSMEVGSAILEL